LCTIVAAVLLVHAPLARAGQVFVEVGLSGNTFSPPNTAVLDHGDIVVWHWTGTNHTVTSGVSGTAAGDGTFTSMNLGVGQTPGTMFSWKFGPNGPYSYYCKPHFPFNMKGTVSFQGAGAQVADLRLTEVRYDGVGLNFVEIANLGDINADMNGFRLVINGIPVMTLPQLVLSPLARTTYKPPGLTTSGSVALYAPHNIPSNAIPTAALTDTLMVDYVEWGTSGGQPLEDMAAITVSPNLWKAGHFAPQVAPGHVLEFCGARHQYGDGFWTEGLNPTPGAVNDCVNPTTPSTWGRMKVLYR
jgi:plastocyanin